MRLRLVAIALAHETTPRTQCIGAAGWLGDFTRSTGVVRSGSNHCTLAFQVDQLEASRESVVCCAVVG